MREFSIDVTESTITNKRYSRYLGLSKGRKFKNEKIAN
jgi:hypothetical protein